MQLKRALKESATKKVGVVCLLAFLFSVVSLVAAYQMRESAAAIYESPYTISNTAREMRSRLLDMKRFIAVFLTKEYVGESKTEQLLEERYALQNAAVERIAQRYLGPQQDVSRLRAAMDGLIECQTRALAFAPGHTEEEILQYIAAEVYPRYDRVSEALTVVIAYANAEVRELELASERTALLFVAISLLLSFFLIALTLYSNRLDQKRLRELAYREAALRDALALAQNANRAKKDFFSRMSHEIRTPMNVIIGMATIAGAHLGERDRVADCLAKIGVSSRHLLSLINDVLDMAKIEEGKLSVVQEPFGLQSLVESVVSIIVSQAREQGLRFEAVLKDLQVETLCGDSMRVSQILLNLLSNAVKFTPAGGEVRLEVVQLFLKNGQARLRFIVSDTGVGMSEAFLTRLFLPFEQADSGIAQKYGGTGLGMPIAKNLVELLNGTIHVQSKLGDGTVFTVELPFGVPESAGPRRTWELESLKALVVDDDADTCAHADILLKNMGIAAHWVVSGSEAVRIVLEAYEAGESYDVCLVDWQMPDMDGVEVTRRIRERVGPEVLIIVLSAYDWSPIEQEARQAGVNAFVAKPLFASSLYNTLLSTFGAPPSQAKEPEPPRPDAYSGKRILVVEDNALNREIALELLAATGAKVDCAVNGKAALEQFRASPEGWYDLILMDVQMPVMNGYEATQAIRVSGRPDARVPIVAMTANVFKEDIAAARAAGMDGHLAKPIDVKLLWQALETAFLVR